ncbi:MAG: 2Fe-2S ferredoxin [Alphaproteobacteria bacterium]|nr:MAG: 2Fe-2S ferredoxin [Alphaproteobacteria bacterium]
MVHIIFVAVTGERRHVEARGGMSVMEAAVNNGVDGIEAECGGACACATCHVFVDDAWADRLAPPEAMEAEMLGAVAGRTARSRLSCQIAVSDALDGLVLYLPETQG